MIVEFPLVVAKFLIFIGGILPNAFNAALVLNWIAARVFKRVAEDPLGQYGDSEFALCKAALHYTQLAYRRLGLLTLIAMLLAGIALFWSHP